VSICENIFYFGVGVFYLRPLSSLLREGKRFCFLLFELFALLRFSHSVDTVHFSRFSQATLIQRALRENAEIRKIESKQKKIEGEFYHNRRKEL
jgi:hypothetical protein